MTDKTLSVAELIESLKKFPPDAAVWCVDGLHYGPVLDPPVRSNGYNSHSAPRGAICLHSMWLAPDEYDAKIWIDHKGKRRVIKPYQSEETAA
jgi:hypothetical protein